jgi:excinuclease ABC subunit C
MRSPDGTVIYVGKAKILRQRLSSYFNSSIKDIKTLTLVRNAYTLETIIVSNEYEALLLENTLIKQYSPKYNIDLKDGKSYPMVRITNETFPRIFKTRTIIEDGSRYFGPYVNMHSLDTLLALIEKLFMLRKCRLLNKRSAPCVYYHIKRCAAPCCGKISVEDYGRLVSKTAALLSGETGPLIVDLTAKMHNEARKERFEAAAALRDSIRSIENISTSNAVVDFDPESRDYIAYASEGVLASFSVFSFRGGKLTGRELFPTYSASEDAESLLTFITNYYTPGKTPPAKIYADIPAGEGEKGGWGFDEKECTIYFQSVFGFVPELVPARSARDTAVMNMAYLNANEDVRKRTKERGNGPALAELKTVLGLRAKPARIEGFDIAQLDGRHPVASLVSFKNGVPDKKNYRYFKLKSVIGIVDDFAAIREAVTRRYARLLREKKPLPSFILIDGGLGQANTARAALNELGADIPLAGLAKRDEEIWLPGAQEPLRLSRRSEGLKLLQAVRDETHRFATSLNRRLRSKDLAFGTLELVDGIGAKRAAAIMNEFGSLAALAEALPADIARRCSINEKLARTVRAAARLALKDAAENKVTMENKAAAATAAASADGL